MLLKPTSRGPVDPIDYETAPASNAHSAERHKMLGTRLGLDNAAGLPSAAVTSLLVTILAFAWLSVKSLVENTEALVIGGAFALGLPALLAAWLTLGVTRRKDLPRRDKRGWVFIALSAGAASIFTTFAIFSESRELNDLSIQLGASAHIATLLFATIGVLHWVRKPSANANIGMIIDLLCVGVFTIAVAYTSITHARLSDEIYSQGALTNISAISTPVIGALLLIAAITVFNRVGNQDLRGSELLATFGVVGLTIADIAVGLKGLSAGGFISVWQTTVATAETSPALVLTWILGLAAIGFGGALRRVAPLRGEVVPLVERSATWQTTITLFPYLLLAIVIGTIAVSGDETYLPLSVLATLALLLLLRCSVIVVTMLKVNRASSIDHLTGAFNHRSFHEQLPQLIEQELIAKRPLALIVLDIDDFSSLNDNFSHAAGDRWLRELAWTIKQVLGPRDLLYRTGGDEFMIISPGRNAEEATALAHTLTESMNLMTSIIVAPTITMGVAAAPKHAETASELMHIATGTCFWGQLRGSGSITQYDPEIVDVLSLEERIEHLESTGRLRALLALAKALDTRDAYTARHSENVARYACAIATELGWSDGQLKLLHVAGLVHDIGKIGVRDSTLRKDGPLSPSEWEEMRMHPEFGARIIQDIASPEIQSWVISHHERVDGTGYPHQLSGTNIPEGARIMAVADAFDAMTTTRSYRPAMEPLRAINTIINSVGNQFDEHVVKAFLKALKHGSINVAEVARRAAIGKIEFTDSETQSVADGLTDPEFHSLNTVVIDPSLESSNGAHVDYEHPMDDDAVAA